LRNRIGDLSWLFFTSFENTEGVMETPRYAIRVPKQEIHRAKTLERILSRCSPGRGRVARSVLAAYAFRNDEGLFARELLTRATQMWLFRSNQRRFCGDFVVVDMSSPIAESRRAWVIDLKRGAPLKLGGGGAGVQLVNAPTVLAEIAHRTGVLSGSPRAEKVTGDRRAVLRHLGVNHPGMAA
jgi:hypothetical protein